MSKILAAPPIRSQLRPISGNSGLPGIGQTFEYIRDPLALMQKRWDRYGEVSWFSMAGRRWVAALGPDACQEVLQNKDRAFVNSDGWSVLIGPFFHGGLMLLDSEEHLRQRRIMQQAFTRSRLEKTVDVLNPAIASRARRLDSVRWVPRLHCPQSSHTQPGDRHLHGRRGRDH